MSEFSEILRDKAHQYKLTQQQIADHINVTRQAVSRWMDGTSEPNVDKFIDLLQLFNLKVSANGKIVESQQKNTSMHLGRGNIINNSVNRISGNNNITGSGINTGNINFSELHEATLGKIQHINIPILTQNNLFEFAQNENGLKSSSLQTISLAINDCFLLNIVDDTMENDAVRVSLKQGDLLLSQINTKPSNGNIVIAKLSKRNQIAIAVYNDHLLDGKYLSFLNPKYNEHKITDDFEVIAIGMAKYIDLMRY